VHWPCLLATLACVALGCDERVLFVDPPVVYDRPDSGSFDPSAEPSIRLGLFAEQLFTPLLEGEDLPIINGFQGGTWVMPAIRGIALTGVVQATAEVVVTATGERVGVLENERARLQSTAQGFTEIVALPVPVVHAPPAQRDPITDLYGQPATLSITLIDTLGRRATATVGVVLIEG
jgi:hypothetical protein